MIFITLGNQNFQFKRLLLEIERLINDGIIQEKVVAQIGHTIFKSNSVETVDFLTKEAFNDYIENARFIITHAGTGSLISCLRKQKKVIAVARLKEFGEHIDNHQIEILDAFKYKNYIIGLKKDLSSLKKEIQAIDDFIPEKFISNNELFNNELIEIIENLGS